MERLEKIDDANWKEFVGSQMAVLLVSKSGCPACHAWAEELEWFLGHTEDYAAVRFGKVVIDGADVEAFKRDNDWLDHVDALPFNAIFVAGEPKASFFGGGAVRLQRRLDRLSGGDD